MPLVMLTQEEADLAPPVDDLAVESNAQTYATPRRKGTEDDEDPWPGPGYREPAHLEHLPFRAHGRRRRQQ